MGRALTSVTARCLRAAGGLLIMSILRNFFRCRVLAAATTLLGVVGIFSTPALAQTTFSNCAALDGYVFERGHLTATAAVKNTITDLDDDDFITIDMRASAGAGGTISAVVNISGSTIFSETFVYGGGGIALGTDVSRSVTYDPPNSGTNIAFNFDTDPFTTAEGIVTFTVTCVSGADTPTDISASRATTIERVRRLLEERPDRARFVRKRLKALWGSDETNDVALANALTRSSNRAPVQVAAATPSRPLVGMAARDSTLAAYAYSDAGASDECRMDDDGLPSLSCVDVWTEAHFTRFKDDGDRDGNFTVVYVGADMHLTPWAIVGLLGQMDWMVDDIDTAGTSARSIGWMTGPYASMRLTPEIFLDFRAAWGRSETDLKTLGANSNFSTTRWLATAQITGNFQYGDTRVSPELSVEYIKEIADDFTLPSGSTIDVGTISIGRVRFGPEIARLIPLSDGLAIEPRIAVRGIWDFNEADVVTLNNVQYNTGKLRGLVEAGAIIHGIEGLNISVSGKYEGLGLEDFEAYGGMLWINVPI